MEGHTLDFLRHNTRPLQTAVIYAEKCLKEAKGGDGRLFMESLIEGGACKSVCMGNLDITKGIATHLRSLEKGKGLCWKYTEDKVYCAIVTDDDRVLITNIITGQEKEVDFPESFEEPAGVTLEHVCSVPREVTEDTPPIPLTRNTGTTKQPVTKKHKKTEKDKGEAN